MTKKIDKKEIQRKNFKQILINDGITENLKYFNQILELVEFIAQNFADKEMEKVQTGYDMLFERYPELFKKRSYVQNKLRQTIKDNSGKIIRRINTKSPEKYCMYIVLCLLDKGA